jgi:hypothetical protein
MSPCVPPSESPAIPLVYYPPLHRDFMMLASKAGEEESQFLNYISQHRLMYLSWVGARRSVSLILPRMGPSASRGMGMINIVKKHKMRLHVVASLQKMSGVFSFHQCWDRLMRQC